MADPFIGQKFGRWTVQSFVKIQTGKRPRIDCACVCLCGTERTLSLSNLEYGSTRSCGCLRNEVARKRATTHGLTKSPSHRSWMCMRSRCNNPNDPNFDRYGGRGISVCERWDDFTLFLFDMGERPSSKHTLDRIDVNGDYCLDNARWATQHQQSRNRRNTIYAEVDGVRMCLKDAAAAKGFKYATVRDRIQRYGWTVEQALSTPVIPKHELSRDGENRYAPAPKSSSFGPSFNR